MAAMPRTIPLLDQADPYTGPASRATIAEPNNKAFSNDESVRSLRRARMADSAEIMRPPRAREPVDIFRSAWLVRDIGGAVRPPAREAWPARTPPPLRCPGRACRKRGQPNRGHRPPDGRAAA